MNVKMIGVVLGREYATRVRKKSFLLTTFLVPLLFAALCCAPVLMMMLSKEGCKNVAVIDDSGIVMQALSSGQSVQYVDCSRENLDSLKKDFGILPYDAIMYVSAIDSTASVSVCTYSEKPLGTSVTGDIESSVTDAVRDFRIGRYGIDNLKVIIDEVNPDINITTYTINEDGGERMTNADVYRILSLVLGIIIFMFVTMFSSSVMQSVIEEKQSKVVEVLLSSVDAVDLMFGKIIGVALVALTQFLLWIVLTFAIVQSVFAIAGKDSLTGVSQNPSEMMEQMNLGGDSAAMMPEVAVPTDIQQIFATLESINIPLILLAFFIFFIFGYLLYASLFAAIGSAVDNADDSNSLQVPLTVPLMLAYFIALYSWNAPDSPLAFWGSMIPFTSPIVMLSRLPFGVPPWELWLSVSILVLTFVLMGWLSAKIYRVGILTSGRKATYKDLWKWLRQN